MARKEVRVRAGVWAWVKVPRLGGHVAIGWEGNIRDQAGDGIRTKGKKEDRAGLDKGRGIGAKKKTQPKNRTKWPDGQERPVGHGARQMDQVDKGEAEEPGGHGVGLKDQSGMEQGRELAAWPTLHTSRFL